MRLIFSDTGYKFNFPSSQTHVPFILFYNHCDNSELHVFGPFLFYLRVSWCARIGVNNTALGA